MFINIVTKPEIGGIAWCYGDVKIVDGNIFMESIVGIVEEVDEDNVKIHEIDRYIPHYAIAAFTFGGIRIRNRGFDRDKLQDRARRHLNDARGHKSK